MKKIMGYVAGGIIVIIVAAIAIAGPSLLVRYLSSPSKLPSYLPQPEEVVVGLRARVSSMDVVDAYSPISGQFSDRCFLDSGGTIVVRSVGETHVVASYVPPLDGPRSSCCQDGLVLVEKFGVARMNSEYKRYLERQSQEQKARDFAKEYLDKNNSR